MLMLAIGLSLGLATPHPGVARFQGAAAQDAPRPTPIDEPASWVKNSDYPMAAIKAGHQGVVGFALHVDASGAVTGCDVTQSSGSAILDEATCGLLSARARFAPAKDAEGKAVAGIFSSKFHWALPAGYKYTSVPANTPEDVPFRELFNSRLTTVLDVAADGTVASCRILWASAGDRGYFPPPETCSSPPGNMFADVAAGRPVQVFYEEQEIVSGVEPLADRDRSGETVLQKRRVRFEVDPTGKAINCVLIEGDPPEARQDFCGPAAPIWVRKDNRPVTIESTVSWTFKAKPKP